MGWNGILIAGPASRQEMEASHIQSQVVQSNIPIGPIRVTRTYMGEYVNVRSMASNLCCIILGYNFITLADIRLNIDRYYTKILNHDEKLFGSD